ncbi:FxsA family protein [Rhizohabitans arisaemae]|uniref:FxsA family protein n=1 Tax=Rhizohabitans arisaemae TaxID=2720610 RepID=UPI0024B1939F|nr:FxsA family protein [Rhizohabitans arisaemae]
MALLLLLAFLAVPALEIWLIIQVGGLIGAFPTVLVLLATGVLGAAIMRRAGRRAFAALQDGLRSGVLPDREVSDGAMVMTGGLLLLIPGFLSDAVGLLFLIPVTRPLVRRFLSWYGARGSALANQEPRQPYPHLDDRIPGMHRNQEESRQAPPRIVRGEVVDDDRG